MRGLGAKRNIINSRGEVESDRLDYGKSEKNKIKLKKLGKYRNVYIILVHCLE